MATRFVNATAETAAAAEHVNYCVLGALNFTSSSVYVFKGLGQLTFNGHTYSGLGELGTVSTIGESSELRPLNPVTLTLSGVDPATLEFAEDRSEYYRRSVRIDFALFDANLQLLTPIENAVWEGSMDTVVIARSEGEASVTLTCENSLATWDKSIGFLCTDEFQQARAPGDLFANHIADNKNKKVEWGGSTVIAGSASDPGRGGGQHRRPPLP